MLFFRLFLLTWALYSCGSHVSESKVNIAFSGIVTNEDVAAAVPILMIKKSPSCAEDERILTSCTGTRVASNYVFTAGHCTYSAEDVYLWHDFTKLQAIVPNREPNRCRKLPKISPDDVIHVGTDQIKFVYQGYEDISVIRGIGLRQKIISPISYKEMLVENPILTLTGFGTTDCFSYGSSGSRVYIEKNSEMSNRYGLGKAFYRPLGPLNEDGLYFSLNSTTRAFSCNGDSGAGMRFIQPDGVERLIAVHVRGSTERLDVDQSGGVLSQATSVSSSWACSAFAKFRSETDSFSDFDTTSWCK